MKNQVMKDLDKKIIQLIADGKTAKEIGVQLNLSRRTIEDRLEKLRFKYDCKKTIQLVKLLENQ